MRGIDAAEAGRIIAKTRQSGKIIAHWRIYLAYAVALLSVGMAVATLGALLPIYGLEGDFAAPSPPIQGLILGLAIGGGAVGVLFTDILTRRNYSTRDVGIFGMGFLVMTLVFSVIVPSALLFALASAGGGVGGGIAVFSLGKYCRETLPALAHKRLAVVADLSFLFGALLAIVVIALLNSGVLIGSAGGVLLLAVPVVAAGLSMALLSGLPNSPYFYLRDNNFEDAARAIANLRVSAPGRVALELDELYQEVKRELEVRSKRDEQNRQDWQCQQWNQRKQADRGVQSSYGAFGTFSNETGRNSQSEPDRQEKLGKGTKEGKDGRPNRGIEHFPVSATSHRTALQAGISAVAAQTSGAAVMVVYAPLILSWTNLMWWKALLIGVCVVAAAGGAMAYRVLVRPPAMVRLVRAPRHGLILGNVISAVMLGLLALNFRFVTPYAMRGWIPVVLLIATHLLVAATVIFPASNYMTRMYVPGRVRARTHALSLLVLGVGVGVFLTVVQVLGVVLTFVVMSLVSVLGLGAVLACFPPAGREESSVTT
ncbi:MAG: hypothetical protein Q4A71_02590 [Actinomycetaceae bacterium]|nr:hypothetical protein [Actinomycetaceae bacterium]